MSATYQEAYDYLTKQVYGPVFFNKLASVYGVSPADEDEAREMANLAVKLRQAEHAKSMKTAGARRNVLAEVNQDLDKVLSKDYGIKNAQQATDVGIKQAAAQLASDKNSREAALVYRDFLSNLSAN